MLAKVPALVAQADANRRATLAQQQRALDGQMTGVLQTLLGTEVAVPDLPELLDIIEDMKKRFGDVVRNVDYFSYSTYHLFNYKSE